MLFTYPLMVAIQEISAQVGRVTGRGIAGNICRHYPGWLVQSIVVLLFAANAINIGADLGAMADAMKLLIGGPVATYVLVFGLICVIAQIFVQYARYVRVLKWLSLSLFAYVAALAPLRVPWWEALKGILVPTIVWKAAFLATLVAIAGTTISPYLFFWQALEEAEDVRVRPQRAPLIRAWRQAPAAFARIRADTLAGMMVILMLMGGRTTDYGRIHGQRMAARAGLAFDSGNGGMRRRDGRELARIITSSDRPATSLANRFVALTAYPFRAAYSPIRRPF
jgi:Mn2+/Fe2+ NRAMP family transporter